MLKSRQKCYHEFCGKMNIFPSNQRKKMNKLPFYYIKPLWENANSNFSRKFAPGFSTGYYKGGLNLKNSVEKPADTQRYQKLCQCKVCLSPLIVGISKNIFCVKSLLIPTLQNLFSSNYFKMPSKCRD